MPEPFVPCSTCHDPLHCGSWQACASTTVLPRGPHGFLDALDPKSSGPHRVGPPVPTKRGGVMVGPGPEGGESKIVDVDYAAIEQRILARMAAIDGAAHYVVAKFHELSKTESGTPLFKHKLPDGSLTPTARLLCNLVVEAIQGEVTL